MLSSLEFRKIIDEINNEYVGAYFDIGNVLQYGYPEQWIDILGTRIKKFMSKILKKILEVFKDSPLYCKVMSIGRNVFAV